MALKPIVPSALGHAADDHRTLVTGVLGDHLGGGLQRLVHQAGTRGLVAGQLVDHRGHGVTAAQQRRPAAGHDTLLDGRTRRRQSVLDAVLLLLQLHLGGGADLDDRHTAGQLGETLLELLAVPVRIGVVDLGAGI